MGFLDLAEIEPGVAYSDIFEIELERRIDVFPAFDVISDSFPDNKRIKKITNEPVAMIETESVNAARRPFRSAKRPMTNDPRGRMKKPIAKTPAVAKSSAVWLLAGKKAPEK